MSPGIAFFLDISKARMHFPPIPDFLSGILLKFCVLPGFDPASTERHLDGTSAKTWSGQPRSDAVVGRKSIRLSPRNVARFSK